MTVRELIKKLLDCDPDMEIVIPEPRERHVVFVEYVGDFRPVYVRWRDAGENYIVHHDTEKPNALLLE